MAVDHRLIGDLKEAIMADLEKAKSQGLYLERLAAMAYVLQAELASGAARKLVAHASATENAMRAVADDICGGHIDYIRNNMQCAAGMLRHR